MNLMFLIAEHFAQIAVKLRGAIKDPTKELGLAGIRHGTSRHMTHLNELHGDTASIDNLVLAFGIRHYFRLLLYKN